MASMNALTNREYTVLLYMKQFPGTYLTSAQIGDALHLSDKTIRKYVNRLLDEVNQHGAEIEATPGYGYRFQVKNEKTFHQFWMKVEAEHKNPREVYQVEEARDRQFFVLHRLFFDQWRPHLSDIEEELYLSLTTVKHLLNDCRKLLKPYRLTLEAQTDRKLTILGSELDKRHFMMDYFFTPKYDNALNPYIDPSFLPKGVSFESLTIVVLDECREARLSVSDFVIQNLVLHLALTIKRIQLGYPLIAGTGLKKEGAGLERRVAEAILARLQKMVVIDFPEEEVQYITIHLSGKSRQIRQPKQENEDSHQELVQVLEKMSQASDQPFEVDQILVEGLLTHLETLKVRLLHGIPLSNPLIGQLRAEHQSVLEESRRYLSSLTALQAGEVTWDEWGYIALHILAARERYKSRRKCRVLVICATGYGSAQMLKSRLESTLGQALNIVDVMSYYQLNSEQLEQIDLIISAIDLSHIWLPVPVVWVNVFLTPKDIAAIQSKIAELRPSLWRGLTKKVEGSAGTVGKPLAEEVFRTHFSKERFLVMEGKQSRKEVLDRLLTSLSAGQSSAFRERMWAQLDLRESMGGVVFEEEVAVPHPPMAQSEEAEVAVAVLTEPLTWDKSHHRVRLVFLLSPSQYSNPHLIQVSQSIGEWIHQDEIRQAFLKAPTFDQLERLMLPILQEKLGKL